VLAVCPSEEVTGLLIEWMKGNQTALDRLMPLVYRELRRLANSYLRREHPGHTLQPTALVNELYLRLVDQNVPNLQSRGHFFGLAAHLMRQMLVDHARSHLAAKRGGGSRRVSIAEAISFSGERDADLVALDDALTSLMSLDPRKGKTVELRFFGGFAAEEIAQALGISAVTVRRELRLAEAWLYREMKKG